MRLRTGIIPRLFRFVFLALVAPPTRHTRHGLAVLKLKKCSLAFAEVLTWSATHRVLPCENDQRVAAELVVLPLDFKLHLLRWRTTGPDDVPNGESSLGREPFAVCARSAEFTDGLDWHVYTSRQIL